MEEKGNDEVFEYDDLDWDPERDLEDGLKAMQKALPEYERAERYFTGEESEKYLSKKLRYALSGSQNDFYVNLAARVVTAVTDRLEIGSLDVTSGDRTESIDTSPRLPDPKKTGELTATQVLNDVVWRDNELDQEVPDLHLKAGYLGDAYLFMWPSENENGEEILEIFVNSPQATRVFYDPQNPRKKLYAIKWWQTKSGHQRVDLFYDNYGVKFKTRSTRPTTNKSDKSKLSSTISARSFVRMTTQDDPDVDQNGVFENPLGQVPFWHYRTSRPYGTPLHKNAYGPQDAVTKLIRQQMTITDFAAFPQRWALGETGEGSDIDFDWGESDDQDPDDLASQLTSSPGGIWVLKNFRGVGQFQEANVDQVLKPLDKFIELMAAVTGTPLTYLNKIRGTASTPLSGAAQRELEASHLKTVEYIQRSFGATHRDLFNTAVAYLTDEEEVRVTVNWAPAWFRDDKETWDAVLSQQAAGVPKRHTLMDFFPEDLVESWGFTEEEPNGPEVSGEDKFQHEQRMPARPELRANQDGDISRFDKHKVDARDTNDKRAVEKAALSAPTKKDPTQKGK